MKKIILIIFVTIFYTTYIFAQSEFVGMCLTGGNQFGTIFKYTAGDTIVHDVYGFKGIPGAGLYSENIIQVGNKFYGTCRLGGLYSSGIIFEYSFSTNTLIKKYDFNIFEGDSPEGGMVLMPNGKLYGTTVKGGINDQGVIFEFDINSNTYIKKFDFDSITGFHPNCTLVPAPNGKLYGTTNHGGTHLGGTIFEYDINSNTLLKKHDLDSAGGTNPGLLILAGNDKFYGYTSSKAANDHGSIFEFNYLNGAFLKIHDFDSIDGYSPVYTLMQASNGKLYGVASDGGSNNSGVIFEYDINAATYTVKKNISNLQFDQPSSSLIEFPSGKLKGVAREGGAFGYGAIYEYDMANDSCYVIYNFPGGGMGNPVGKLYPVANGKLYGGGNFSAGSQIYEFKPLVNSCQNKIVFNSSEAAGPKGSLCLANNGKYYGTTNIGGSENNGVIFEYDYGNNTIAVKHDMDIYTGELPIGNLTQASNGKLYGMATWGGSVGGGVIYEYNTVSNTYTVKVNFNFQNGFGAYGSLVLASDGNLYGMTHSGGVNGMGNIFKYDYISDTFTNEFDFTSALGSHPNGSLIEAANEKLYGLTFDGGTNNKGVIFEYDYVNNIYTKKFNLGSNYNGNNPYGSLLEVDSCVFYGMTSLSGQNSKGTIFKFVNSTGSFTKIHDFDSIGGHSPKGSLTYAGNGKMYGMTMVGGLYDSGVIFEVDTTGVYTPKVNLELALTGGYPEHSNLVKTGCMAPFLTASGPVAICQGDSVTLFAHSLTGNTYQWKRNNVLIPGATDSFYVAHGPGRFSVTVTDTVDCLLPLTSNSFRVRIVCYPPPTENEKVSDQALSTTYDAGAGILTVETDFSDKFQQLIIIDNLGRQVLNQECQSENSFFTKQVNCMGLSPGMYTVLLVSERYQLIQKFVKPK